MNRLPVNRLPVGRLEELSLGHVEGSLSREERAELARLCGEDRKALAFVAGEVQAARVIREALSETDTAAARERVLASLEALSQVAESRALKSAVLKRLRSRLSRTTRRLRPMRPIRSRPSSRIWIGAGVAAAAAVLLAVFFSGGPRTKPRRGIDVPAPARVAQVTSAEGGVDLRRSRDGRWAGAGVGAVVFEGDSLHTRGGPAHLRTESGSVVHVNAATTVAFETHGARPKLSVGSGELFVETTEDDRGLTVETPHGRVADTGTRFGISVGQGGTTVAVLEGSVSAWTDAGRAEVGANQEVLLKRRTDPPGEVREAKDLAARFCWARIQPAAVRPVALYLFDEGGGRTVHDRSGFGEPLDLRILDPHAVTWTEDGLDVVGRSLIRSETAAGKIVSACAATNEVSVEVWLRPASTDQIGPARIVAISSGSGESNLVLGQGTQYDGVGTKYVFRVRTTSPHEPLQLETPPGALSARLTHVVATRDAAGTRRIYLDGDMHAEQRLPGDLSNWKAGRPLVLADETSRDRPWLGGIFYLAIYDRALSEAQVRSRYEAGVQSARERR